MSVELVMPNHLILIVPLLHSPILPMTAIIHGETTMLVSELL